MLQSEGKLKYDQDLNSTLVIANGAGDERIKLISETSQNLDQIVAVLASYYVDSNTEVHNSDMVKQLDSVKGSRYLFGRMLTEYLLKKDSGYFNKTQGANDLFEQGLDYLIKYATFANMLNDSITGINKYSDFKFSMFEIYSNVIITSFSHVTPNELTGLLQLDKADSIVLLNTIFKIEDSYVVTRVDRFSKIINQFNDNYYKSDRVFFATNLHANMKNASSAYENTYEEIAAFYLKEIYGISL